VEAVGSYEMSIHMCRPHSIASYGTAIVQCSAIKTSVDSALTNQCMSLQLEITVCIGRLFGHIALSMLKDDHNSEEPFLCRRRELVTSEHEFLCHSDITCELYT